MKKTKQLEFYMIKGTTANRSCPLCNYKLDITTKRMRKEYNCTNCNSYFYYMSNAEGRFEISHLESNLLELQIVAYYHFLGKKLIIFSMKSSPLNATYNFRELLKIQTDLLFPLSREQLINKIKTYLLFL